MASANQVELHTHGIVDPEISDMAALVLSGKKVEDSLLLASDVANLALRGRPGVVLGACAAAQRATYGALPRSLPMAFLRAGASWVIASPQPVEDFEAPAFFEGIWRRIRAGAAPAIALRDERSDARWSQARSSWTRDVVLFN
jgi:CHAT domain-containing protein